VCSQDKSKNIQHSKTRATNFCEEKVAKIILKKQHNKNNEQHLGRARILIELTVQLESKLQSCKHFVQHLCCSVS
jgi:hypothetical protein